MSFRIKLIQNLEEREHCVSYLNSLSQTGSCQTMRVKERRDLLLKLVQDYDRQCLLNTCADPIDAIRHQMVKQGIKQKDLAPVLGGKNRVSEVLARRRQLTLPMIRRLHQHLDIPAELLIREIQPLQTVPTGAALTESTDGTLPGVSK